MKIFTIPKTETNTELHTEELPVLDNGYFDVLVAIGYAALADAYYEGPSPTIHLSPVGFKVTHALKSRKKPNLSWLKYSLAASWKNKPEFESGELVKKSKTWDDKLQIYHEGAVVDTSESHQDYIDLGNRSYWIESPLRNLYGVINSFLKKDVVWFNGCIQACREKGIELLENKFEHAFSTNSVVLPQGSKGANSSSGYSILNGSLPTKLTKKWSREICLSVAGLIFSSRGARGHGFAIPTPNYISLSMLKHLVYRNRKRIVPKDFFFPFNNYLYFLKLLLGYGDHGNRMLFSVCGAKFIELGTQSSPSGVWELKVPRYKYTMQSVENLISILDKWRVASIPSGKYKPNINRLSVERLIRGFENADINAFTEGYLSYLDSVGFKEGYLPLLRQKQFYEIMNSSSKKYQTLVEELTGPEVQTIIRIVSQDTYDKRIKDPNRIDYGMIRKLREVQNSKELVTAICEISIKRSTDKMASQKTDSNEREKHTMPTQAGITKIIELSEDERYTPKLIAQLILALALSTPIKTNE